MIEKIKYDIGDKVIIYDVDLKDYREGIISMIIVNKKGIKYRAKFGFNKQGDFSQEYVVKKVD